FGEQQLLQRRLTQRRQSRARARDPAVDGIEPVADILVVGERQRERAESLLPALDLEAPKQRSIKDDQLALVLIYMSERVVDFGAGVQQHASFAGGHATVSSDYRN